MVVIDRQPTKGASQMNIEQKVSQTEAWVAEFQRAEHQVAG
jgi:hypothetical protein